MLFRSATLLLMIDLSFLHTCGGNVREQKVQRSGSEEVEISPETGTSPYDTNTRMRGCAWKAWHTFIQLSMST